MIEKTQDVVCEPSIVSTRKAVADQKIVSKFASSFKSFVGMISGQLYQYSLCQSMPTKTYARQDFH